MRPIDYLYIEERADEAWRENKQYHKLCREQVFKLIYRNAFFAGAKCAVRKMKEAIKETESDTGYTPPKSVAKSFSGDLTSA